LSQGHDQWTLAEIEQVLLTAAQQLQLAGNIHAAIIALESADTRLQRLNKPQFTALRRAIAADLARLRASPQIDITGLSAKLDALVAQQANWPLASAHATAVREPKPDRRPLDFGNELLSEIKSIVQIRRIGVGETALLPPEQEYFLRENIKLRLLSARLALLSKDQTGFHADIVSAEQLLAKYFNSRDSAVSAAMSELKRLGSLQIAVQAPDIQASLAVLGSYRAR
jgi:uroporphyrin-3 C-methyltransferase